MILKDVVSTLKDMAPLHLAEKWDNVGLLVEPSDSATREVKKVFLTNDLTEAVLDEAIAAHSDLILSYHPPIFAPIKSLTNSSAKQRIIVKAIENRVAIYSPHTAFDSVEGGVNDWIIQGLSGPSKATIKPLQPHTPALSASHKVTVFVPEDAADKVRDAMAAAGAGIIGNYSLCSFSSAGTGTFKGNDKSNPVVGSKGVLERAPEVRMEMVCPSSKLAEVSSAIHRTHPYETPAWEVHALAGVPSSSVGQGRIAKFDDKITLAELVARVKSLFQLDRVRVAVPDKYLLDGRPQLDEFSVGSVASCAGAGSTVLQGVSADVYVTGEMRHHEVLEATASGHAVVLCDHSNTERGFLRVFKTRLEGRTEGALQVEVSKCDQDPLMIL